LAVGVSAAPGSGWNNFNIFEATNNINFLFMSGLMGALQYIVRGVSLFLCPVFGVQSTRLAVSIYYVRSDLKATDILLVAFILHYWTFV